MISTSFPRPKACVALLMALVASAATAIAQIPVASSARTIPTEVEQSEGRVTQIVTRAEDHFRRGKLNLEDNKLEQARGIALDSNRVAHVIGFTNSANFPVTEF